MRIHGKVLCDHKGISRLATWIKEGDEMKKQMTRHEWNEYCKKTEPVPGKCELLDCPYKEAVLWHKLDCLDCKFWVEDEQDE